MSSNNVWVAVYDHAYGIEVRVFVSEAMADSWATDIATEWWDTEFPGEERPNDEDIADEYFRLMMERHPDSEFFHVHEAKIEGLNG